MGFVKAIGSAVFVHFAVSSDRNSGNPSSFPDFSLYKNECLNGLPVFFWKIRQIVTPEKRQARSVQTAVFCRISRNHFIYLSHYIIYKIKSIQESHHNAHLSYRSGMFSGNNFSGNLYVCPGSGAFSAQTAVSGRFWRQIDTKL